MENGGNYFKQSSKKIKDIFAKLCKNVWNIVEIFGKLREYFEKMFKKISLRKCLKKSLVTRPATKTCFMYRSTNE